MMSVIKNRLFGSKEIQNAGWIVGGKIAQMLFAFIVDIWTARYLGPENYGEISYASVYVVFFSSLSTLGINSIIIKEFIDHPDEQGKAIGTTIFLRFIASVVSEIMIVGIVSVINRNETVTITVTILCSIALFFQVTDTIHYWFQSKYLSKVVSVATLLAYVASTICRIIFLILKKDVRWFAFASSVNYICLSIIMLVAYRKYGGSRFSVSMVKAKELIKKSYHFIIIWVSVVIYEQTDKIMLRQMINEAEVGYYSLAAKINSIGAFVLAAMIESFSPTIMRYEKIDKKMFEQKNRQLYAFIIYTSLGMALAFTFSGREVVHLLYGDEYLGTVAPLKVLCWYTVFFQLVSARNIWFISKNQQKYLKYCYVIAALSNVLLNLLLVPILGASGAALASLITQMLSIVVIPLFIKEMRDNAKLMLDAVLLRGVKQ